MDRALAAIALLVGVAALVIALAGSGDRRPEPAQREIERRVGRLELEMADLQARLDAVPRGTSAGQGEAADAREPAEWPVVARRLTLDLELDSRQTDIVDKTLEECAGKLEGASKRKSPLWRDRLSKRARREAYTKIAACLRADQKKSIEKWLKVPGNSHLACWLLPQKPCGGCGKRRSSKGRAKGGGRRK